MNTHISDEDKLYLFNAMFAHEYDELIQIDLLSGDATTIHASDPVWYKSVGVRFPFESVMQRFMEDHSIDPHTDELIDSLKISHIGEQLEHHHVMELYFSARDEETGSFLLKNISFYRVGMTQALMTIKDITDAFHQMSSHVQDLENALKDVTNQVEERNAFLTLLSRSLRAPLHSIMGLTQLGSEDVNSDGIEDYLHKISVSGSYMSETIDDILDLRRMARGETDLHPEPVSMRELMHEVEPAAVSIAESGGLTLKEDLSELDAVTVEVDPHCLKQTILKLVQCAAGNTARGGHLKLSVREVYRADHAIHLEILVDCRGVMLNQEQIAALFQPHAHVVQQITSDLTAMDIALIILKNNCLALGAKTLLAETDEARGTRLSLSLNLPLLGAEHASTAVKETEAPTDTPDFTGCRMLLVDDNHINLEVTKRILQSEGIEVLSAVNGADALDIYRKEKGRFDLILMDILMPVMDGLEATRRIRAMEDIPGSASIPIIALTANAFREDFEESLRSGIDAHLVKPIDSTRLFHIMAVLLKK